jgi:hypothetical protein
VGRCRYHYPSTPPGAFRCVQVETLEAGIRALPQPRRNAGPVHRAKRGVMEVILIVLVAVVLIVIDLLMVCVRLAPGRRLAWVW